MTEASNGLQKKRILFYSEGWGLGGIESFVMNTIKTLDLDRYSFDIFCTHDWDNSHDAVIRQLGGRRYTVFPGEKPNLVKRLIKSTKAWKGLLLQGHYDIVHINTMNGVGFVYAKIARQCGVPVRIVHSHNSDFGSGFRGVKNIAHVAGKKIWGNSATVRLACSKEAGYYLFGNYPFTIIPNCIDADYFRFSPKKRTQIRSRYGIADSTIVFGSVGRLSEAKNPIFQVEILSRLVENQVDAALMLVGDGPYKEKVINKAEELGIAPKVILPGAQLDTAPYYSALDVFTMPHFFEGFGITAAEAMASGLPCICSNTIPPFPFSYPFEKRLYIEKVDMWAEYVCDFAHEDIDRKKGSLFIKRNGFDIKAVQNMLESIYENR